MKICTSRTSISIQFHKASQKALRRTYLINLPPNLCMLPTQHFAIEIPILLSGTVLAFVCRPIFARCCWVREICLTKLLWLEGRGIMLAMTKTAAWCGPSGGKLHVPIWRSTLYRTPKTFTKLSSNRRATAMGDWIPSLSTHGDLKLLSFLYLLSISFSVKYATPSVHLLPKTHVRLLDMDSWRIAVLGDGNVGKTALAVQVSVPLPLSLRGVWRSLSLRWTALLVRALPFAYSQCLMLIVICPTSSTEVRHIFL